MSKASPPAGLGRAGKALWREIITQLSDDGLVPDRRESRWLFDAAREADQLADIEAALADAADLVVLGSQKQPVAHPLLGEARRSRQVIAALLARIGMQDPAVETAAGPGRGSRTTSETARRAARARWDRGGA
jgi:hypothetical protein